MKRSLLAAIIAVSLMPALPARFVDSAIAALSPEDDLRKLIAAWDDALKDRNAQALTKVLADNFTMTDASGAVLTKAEYLQAVVKTPALRMIKSYASQDLSITVDPKQKGEDETATVTGHSEIKGRARGGAQMVAGVYRFTDRWMKIKGEWRVVSTTAIREP
jgi:ketosteroid isomerase-like protein